MKNIKLTDETHSRLKEYCQKKGYKISGLLERIILEHLKREGE